MYAIENMKYKTYYLIDNDKETSIDYLYLHKK